MKLNFDAEILDLVGKPLQNGEDGSMTLNSIACAALINVLQEDQSMSADDKVKMFRLAQVASKGGVQDVKAEDVALLKPALPAAPQNICDVGVTMTTGDPGALMATGSVNSELSCH